MGSKRRRYSREFKVEAAGMVFDKGMMPKQMAEDLGINVSVIRLALTQFCGHPNKSDNVLRRRSARWEARDDDTVGSSKWRLRAWSSTKG